MRIAPPAVNHRSVAASFIYFSLTSTKISKLSIIPMTLINLIRQRLTENEKLTGKRINYTIIYNSDVLGCRRSISWRAAEQLNK